MILGQIIVKLKKFINDLSSELRHGVGKYDGVIIAVAHEIFKDLNISFISSLCKKSCDL